MKNHFYKIIVLFFIYLYVNFNIIFAISRSKDIPGVDPLPIAIIEEKKDTPNDTITPDTKDQKQPAITPTTKESITKEYPDFPRIRNIKVVQDPTYPFSARITWELHPQTSTPIYVVRFTRPISTRDILLNAYNLTSPPLSANTTSFIDIDIPEGVYYYAAVTSFELSKDGILVLKPDVNYTITPFIVYRDKNLKKEEANPDNSSSNIFNVDRKDLTPMDFEVQELTATNTDKTVVLNWKPLNLDKIKYRIYKGIEPLDSVDRLKNAKFLGESIAPNFIDENPVPDETVYYGVSVFDEKENKEYTNLKFKRSYIANTYKKPKIEYQFMEFTPDSLVAYQINKNTIQIFWVDAGPQVKFYKVYRHSYPISNEKILEQSEFLGISQSGNIGYLDKDLKPGRYFYAIMPVISNNNELKIFQSNRTFTTFGIIIHETQEPEKKQENEKKEIYTETKDIKNNIKNISIRIEDSNNVRISWDYSMENASKIKVLIYRSPILIQKYEDIKENGIYVGEFPLVAGVYVDKNLTPGNYYYNFIEYNTDSNEISAFYYLKRPVEIRKKEQQESELVNIEIKKETKETKKEENLPEMKDNQEQTDKTQTDKKVKINVNEEIDSIIDLILKNKNYSLAESKINSLLQSQDLDSYNTGKLKYYYGILLYKTDRINEARRYFLDKDVQKFDQQSADFWYKRSLEKR